jgi:hypothetical protein
MEIRWLGKAVSVVGAALRLLGEGHRPGGVLAAPGCATRLGRDVAEMAAVLAGGLAGASGQG